MKSKKKKPATASANWAVIADPSKAVATRIAKLGPLTNGLLENDGVFAGLLALLKNTEEPPQLRRAVLRTLQAASFSVVAFNARRPAYLAALRKVATDPDAEMRQSVLGLLAREKDGYAQQLLLEGLEDPSKALLPAEKALQLMSYDIKTEAYPIARKIVREAPNPQAKREALRLLAADAKSVPLFESVLRDKKESPELRRISATALQVLNPSAMEGHARQIVLDDDEDDELKATSLTALSHFGRAEIVGPDDELRAKVDQLKETSSSVVKQGARQFLGRYRR